MGFESSTNRMIYKRDYRIVVSWDINDNMYWTLFRKGIPVQANEEEMELVNSVLKLK